jgi:hypothetical protein
LVRLSAAADDSNYFIDRITQAKLNGVKEVPQMKDSRALRINWVKEAIGLVLMLFKRLALPLASASCDVATEQFPMKT